MKLTMSVEDAAALTAAVALEMAGGTTDAHTRYAGGGRTFRHNNGQDAGGGSMFGDHTRGSGGRLARFASRPASSVAKRSDIELRPDNPALSEGRTIFPSRVFDAGAARRVLVHGRSNAKIGGYVTVGAWAGMPIYLLTLEERATCPRTCQMWSGCYGNSMPSAQRFRHDDTLIHRIEEELAYLNRKHPRGFSVRLHVLGDFVDVDYLRRWAKWSDRFPALRVWGYTAHGRESPIGRLIRVLNATRPARWQIRFSVSWAAPHGPMQAAVLWEKPGPGLRDGMIVCPQELGKVQTCGACGICWKPELANVRVGFLAHGGRGNKSD